MKQTITLSAFLLAAICSSATIQYQYLNDLFDGNTINYDMDNDGDNDFAFQYGGIGGVQISSSKPTSLYATDGSNDNPPKAYNYGAALGTHTWHYGMGPMVTNFSSNGTKYLMVKFNNASGSTFNGWFEIEIIGTDSYIIQSCAYSDIPNGTIVPGQGTPTGIADVDAMRLLHFSGQQFSFETCTQFDRVRIYNTAGQLLSEITEPQAMHQYSLPEGNSVLLISLYRNEEVVGVAKHYQP